jgi:hypothetical protein
MASLVVHGACLQAVTCWLLAVKIEGDAVTSIIRTCVWKVHRFTYRWRMRDVRNKTGSRLHTPGLGMLEARCNLCWGHKNVNFSTHQPCPDIATLQPTSSKRWSQILTSQLLRSGRQLEAFTLYYRHLQETGTEVGW